MFDDPKKELQRLQGKLLAAEEPEWEPEEVDPETALEEVLEILEKRPIPEIEDEIADEPEVPEQKKSRFAGLVLALILETLVLVLLVAWWVLCR